MRPSFRMTIDADLGDVARVNAAFAEFAGAQGLPVSIRRSIHVVLDELLTNSIRHGLADRDGGSVTVEAELGPDRIAVTLTDDGPPFDPFALAAPDTALPVEERPIGGLGVHLVRGMMDEVSYQRRGDRNVVVVAKRLADGTKTGHRKGRAMQITTRTHNDVTVVALAGNLDSNTSPEAQQALEAILAGGGKKVLLDCTALDYISSAGLRVLLGTTKRLGGGLRLFGLNATVREVFDISGFSTILAVCATERDALDGF